MHLSVKLSSKLCTVLLQVKVYIGNKALTQEGSALKQPSPNFFECTLLIYVYLFIFKLHIGTMEVLIFSLHSAGSSCALPGVHAPRIGDHCSKITYSNVLHCPKKYFVVSYTRKTQTKNNTVSAKGNIDTKKSL